MDTETGEKKLEDCTYKNTKKFSFKDRSFDAKCIKVYDGDTITVAFLVFGEFYRFSIRMDGYDSPEIRSKNTEEKKWAIASKEYLSNLVLGKNILLKCKDFDKYGRILAQVEINGTDVNALMISDGYCRPYGGGHKIEWDFSQFEKKDD